MFSHADQIVTFVRVDQLLEEGATVGQRFRENHTLLEVNAVVGGAVNLGNNKREKNIIIIMSDVDTCKRKLIRRD
jgi:hypothetical protein